MSNSDNFLSLFAQIRQEALKVQKNEPAMNPILQQTVLSPTVQTFQGIVAITLSYQLQQDNKEATSSFYPLLLKALSCTSTREGNHSLCQAVYKDIFAVIDRDPACETALEVLLFFKGFAALTLHRVARYHYYSQSRFTALWLQSLASATWGVDIHPAATIGAGLMLDHGTGIVIGETAVIGDGCTLLHGVTLGGNGKDHNVDRHPKVGDHVLIGASASLLGNIQIGDGCKIGAGSVVLSDVPAGATAVGVPAKIIGHVKEKDPAAQLKHCFSSLNMRGLSSSMTSSMTSSISPSKNGVSATMKDPDHNCCDVFREYVRLAEAAPRNTITIKTLGDILKQRKDVTRAEIGAAFFALDTENKGYVSRQTFIQRGKECIQANCRSLSSPIIENLLNKCPLYNTLPNNPKTFQLVCSSEIEA
mmetsp:Transcript_6319/g.9304  ORF Transcript_6319/g.9304 Transcript_6319/m.9304 type:complete len:419 (-) Transcript_6319:91-1347(-)